MLSRYLLLITFLFSSISFAKNYTIDFVVDDSSNHYVNLIKKETSSLFSSYDKITYNISVCQTNCNTYINNSKKLILLKQPNKYLRKSNNYIITYNLISSNYDKNKILRTTALAIYEILKENKFDSVYIKNKKISTISFKDNKNNTNMLDLKKVFKLLSKNNLQIKQNLNTIKLNDLNIDEVKSSYKPSIDIYSNYTRIDEDRALYSSGLYSEGSLNAGVKLTQLIYSNKVSEDIKIKKLLSKSSENELKALNDEITYKATLLYLNILKSKKTNNIIRIKQDFIKQNLEFAKQRVIIGVKDRSDVYRWQSELADVNIDLANTNKVFNSLKIELGNLLQISSKFDILEYGINSSLFKLNNKDAIKYIEDKKVQANFSKSIVHTHSTLKQIKTLRDVKTKELTMNKDSRYLPTIAFEGNVNKILNRDGVGSNATRYADNDEYSAVLNIHIPLYEGGIKSTRIAKNKIELVNLKLQYENIKNLIIENISKNFESLKRSYEKIKFAKISEESSKKNFELISDKYKNGKENIISLLDAQDAYIISKLNLNISNIEYLSDLSSIYFFSGKIDILVDNEKKKEVEENILNIVKGL